MRILVASDTHGSLENLERAFEIEKPDEIFHLGDGLGCEEILIAEYGVPVTIVRGNCDWGSDLPAIEVRQLGNHKAFLTHGHMYGVDYGLGQIIEAAEERDADVIIYGHTHIPELTFGYYGKTILNPGSLTRPRQKNRVFTYGVIEVKPDGELDVSLHQI